MKTFICPHCNQTHPSGARYCPVTGQSISPQSATCRGCGRETKGGVKFCPYCGSQELVAGVQDASAPAKKRWRVLLWIVLTVGGLGIMAAGVFLLLRNIPLDIGQLVTGLVFPTQTPAGELEGVARLSMDEGLPEDAPQAMHTTTPYSTPKPTSTKPATSTLIGYSEQEIVSTHAAQTVEAQLTLQASAIQPTITPHLYQTNTKDNAELIYIPPGEFLMGSDPDSDPYFWGAEGPMHRVSLDGYWIYRTEVTNAMYQACVEDRACPRPAYNRSSTRPEYFGNPIYADYPVVFVSWRDAAAYCLWAGGRLPSEAEWEKAARGEDARLFPWGNELPNGDKLNYCDWNCTAAHRDPSQDDGYRDTAPVGNYLEGASSYGVLDMAGNVWEWTFDWFQETYYKVSPGLNPRGPASGTHRVIRGGSWHNPVEGIRTVVRASFRPGTTLESLGFRCVVDNP